MRRFAKTVLLGSLLILGVVVALKGAALLVPSGSWVPEGTMASARSSAAAALLPDGRILITGGDSGSGPVASADFINVDGTISAAPPMIYARSKHFAVALQDGRVFVAGGITAGGSATSIAEIFDPVASSWTNVGAGMTEARSGATAVVLQDGRVLIAGGQNGTAISSTIEIFDPALGAFTPAGMLSSPRTQHAMAMLQDGRVLIVGGSNGTAPLSSTDIFDPVAGTVSAGPSLASARFGHSATTLLNGQVVVIGGNNGNAIPTQMDVTPTEIFDPTAGTFTTLATNLATPREGHLAFLLPNNNNVLIVGGTSAGTAVASAELFSQWQGTFAATGTMATARSSGTGAANQVSAPTSVMQRNGVVMVAGGTDASGNALNTTEAYGYPTVQTDQGDYPPGSIVTITGSEWQPGETVTLTFVESPLFDTHPALTAVADSNGNIVNTQFSPDVHDIDIRFYLTASGGTSNFQAQTTFTDAAGITFASPGVTVGTQGGTTPVYGTGGTATYAVSVVRTSSGNASATLSISGLPVGATGSFNPADVSFGGSTKTEPSTLTITTSATTPAGSTTFTVTATDDKDSTNFVTALGNLTVGKKTVTPSVTASNKTYDGTDAATTACTLTGVTAADAGNVTCAATTATFSDKNVGNGKTVTATGITLSGSASGNYQLSPTTATTTANINPLAITVTAVTQTKTYDGSTSSTGVPTIVPALISPDTASFTQMFDSRNAGTRTLTPSGTVNDGNSGGNYTETFKTATGTINPLAITVTAVTQTKTYDGSTSSTGVPTIAPALMSPDTANFTQMFDSRNAGTRTLTPSGTVNDGNSGGNYTETFKTATGTISPLAITVTAVTQTKTYDGSASSTGVPTIVPALISPDTANFTQMFDSRNAGSRTLTPSGTVNDGNSGGNYTETFKTATGTISPLAITVTAVTQTKTYDGSTSSTGVPTIVPALIAPDTANFTQMFDSRNAGTRTLTPSGTVSDGNSGGNYTETFKTATGTISPLAITVTAVTQTKTYDGSTSSTGVPTIVPALISPDTANFTQMFDSRNAGSRTLTPSGTVNDGNSGGNYTETFKTATGTISPLAITVTAVSDAKTYDGNTSSTGVPTIAPSLIAPDTANFTQVFDSRNAGGRTLTPSGMVNDGNGGNNYAYMFATALGTINKRPITVTAASDTKTYDGTISSTGTPTITLGSLASGDTTTNFTQVFDSRNAGTRTLTPSGTVNDGNGGTNYAYTFTTASGSISARPITVMAASDTKTYDGTISSTGTPAITLGSLASGDSTANFTQVFDSRNASAPNGRTLTASGTVNDGNSGDNYAYTFATAVGTITKRPITVTAASDTKTYDGTISSTGTPTITLGSLASGDTTTNFTQVFDSRNAGTRTLTPSGTVNDSNGGANYAYTFTTANGNINALAVTVTLTAPNKTYDGNVSEPNNGMSCTLTGVLSIDSMNVVCTATSGMFNTSQVATANQVTAMATISGTAASNYTLGAAGTALSSTSTSAPASIMTKAATVTPNATSKTYGSADPAFTGTLTGFLAADGVTATYTRTAGETVAASPYTISATLSPALVLDNYTITYNTANFTISPAASATSITGSTPNSSVYDQPITLSALVSSASSATVNEGMVAFTADSVMTPLCTTGNVFGGAASCTTGPLNLAVGTHTIIATYVPGTDFFGSGSASVPQTVTARHTSTTITSTEISNFATESVPIDTTVHLQVTVTDDDSNGTPITPTGTFSIMSLIASDTFSPADTSGNGLCNLTGSGASASCSLTVTPIEADLHELTANYPGDPVHVSSTQKADLMVTAPLVSQKVCLDAPFNGTAIPANSTVWFNAVFQTTGQKITTLTHLTFFNQTIQIGNGTAMHVPDGVITFDPSATLASTTFDPVNDRWNTTLPTYNLAGKDWLSGMPVQLPSGLPGSTAPVTWCGQFDSDSSTIALGWQWAAAVYTNFVPFDPNSATDLSGVGVKSVDDNKADVNYKNSDHAGTPENYLKYVIGGARGGGGGNYTGGYSGSGNLK